MRRALVAVSLMMLPATARFWAQEVWSMAAVAAGIAVLSGYLGLLLSYHHNLPSGPAIILMTAGMTYLLSIALGHRDGLLVRFLSRKHLQA